MNTIPKIEELDISPAPWTVNELGSAVISESAEDIVCPICADDKGRRDANLIAAAPELFDCLREAVVEMCYRCDDYCADNCGCNEKPGKCFVQRWRAALTKAAGGAE